MKQDILRMIEKRPGTSFVELESIEGFSKNYDGESLLLFYGKEDETNIVLWGGV